MQTITNIKVERLSELPNIGTVLEKQLEAVGITSYEKLCAVGARQAWLQIQAIDESACIHRLLALEGAIEGVRKNLLSDQTKEELKEFYQWNKK